MRLIMCLPDANTRCLCPHRRVCARGIQNSSAWTGSSSGSIPTTGQVIRCKPYFERVIDSPSIVRVQTVTKLTGHSLTVREGYSSYSLAVTYLNEGLGKIIEYIFQFLVAVPKTCSPHDCISDHSSRTRRPSKKPEGRPWNFTCISI